MRERHLLPAVLILLVLVQMLLLVFGAGVARQTSDSPSVASAPPPAPGTLPLTIETGMAAARTQADRWNPNAMLIAASMQIDWPLTVDVNAPAAVAPGGWIAYTFALPDNVDGSAATSPAIRAISLLYERRSGGLVDQQSITWPPSIAVAPFTDADYRISSSTAVTALELKQGQAWRAACPRVRHVTRVSLAHGGSAVWWVIGYGDTRTGAAALQGRVNTDSGDLEDVIDRSEACDQSS